MLLRFFAEWGLKLFLLALVMVIIWSPNCFFNIDDACALHSLQGMRDKLKDEINKKAAYLKDLEDQVMPSSSWPLHKIQVLE